MSSAKTTQKRARSAKQSNKKQKSRQRQARSEGGRASSDEMHNDLVGIVIALIGLICFVAACFDNSALLTNVLFQALHYAFGIAAYLVPLIFILWGVSYFFQIERAQRSRLFLSAALIILALMGFLALFQPQIDDADLKTLFDTGALWSGGGYFGSGLAWCLMTLFGRIISYIILAALIIIGLIYAGLSISALVGTALAFFTERKPKIASDTQADAAFIPGVKRGSAGHVDKEEAFALFPESDETIVLGNEKRSSLSTQLSDINDKTSKLEAKTEEQPLYGDEQNAVKTRVISSAHSSSRNKTTDGFTLPSMSILNKTRRKGGTSTAELKQTAQLLQQTLEEFNLPAKVLGWLAGPTVTMFKVELANGVRLAKLTGLSDDIALSLAASAVRVAQIPNTSLVGIEIPNKTRSNVLLGDILPEAQDGPLQIAIGEDVDGKKICVDLAKMPHLLIGGTTGSGKSVCINAMLMSILMRATPAEVRMILIDPKRVELSLYNGIPHLYVPVVTEAKEAASALRWCVTEMERRLKIFERAGVRNIAAYNQTIQSSLPRDAQDKAKEQLAYLVIVIDELSDLMMVAGKDVEDSICRIAQLARAAGIHLIVATQRPSSNVVTGMIKANITNRIAFNVATNVDSRVILDQSGAEKLVGLGDMLFIRPQWSKPKRIQGCYVDETEINTVVGQLKEQATPHYHDEILKTKLPSGSKASRASCAPSTNDDEDDPLIWDAAEAIVNAGLGSTSMLQRRLKVGYARAGRIMDMLEAKGIVGPQNGSRAREVLVTSEDDLNAIKALSADIEEQP